MATSSPAGNITGGLILSTTTTATTTISIAMSTPSYTPRISHDDMSIMIPPAPDWAGVSVRKRGRSASPARTLSFYDFELRKRQLATDETRQKNELDYDLRKRVLVAEEARRRGEIDYDLRKRQYAVEGGKIQLERERLGVERHRQDLEFEKERRAEVEITRRAEGRLEFKRYKVDAEMDVRREEMDSEMEMHGLSLMADMSCS